MNAILIIPAYLDASVLNYLRCFFRVLLLELLDEDPLFIFRVLLLLELLDEELDKLPGNQSGSSSGLSKYVSN